MAPNTMEILAAARRIEEFGIKFYQRFSECAREERGAALLRGLARDEMMHLQHIENEMRRISPGTDLADVSPAESLLGIAPEAAFPFPTGNCMTLEGEIAAMETGIQVEIASVKMYKRSVKMVDEPGAKGLLERLSHIEERHRNLLERNLELLKDEGAWYGYTPILEG